MNRKTLRALLFPAFGLILGLVVAVGVYAYLANNL